MKRSEMLKFGTRPAASSQTDGIVRGEFLNLKTDLVYFATVIAVLVSGFSTARAQGPATFSYEGVITDTNGYPLEAASVLFTLQVTSPNGQCVLYEEQQTQNMTGSAGHFTLWLGQGTLTTGAGNQNPNPTIPFASVFSNLKPFVTATCPGGGYTPAAGDTRRVTIAFNDGTTTTVMSPSISIGSSPYAMEADSLQGKKPVDFIQANTSTAAVTQSNLESVFNNAASVTQLQALIAGTSVEYAKSSTTSGTSTTVSSGSPPAPAQGAIWFDTTTGKLSFFDGTAAQSVGTSGGSVSSVTAGSGLTGGTITTSGTISMPTVGTAGTYAKVTTDSQGRVTAGAPLVAGDIPTLDASKLTTGTFASAMIPSGTDSTKLPLAGGTMTGAISMGGQNLTSVGYITIAGSHYLGLGTYTDSAEATLIGTLNTSYAGVTWFNTTSNQVKYWNGSAALALASNGQTATVASGGTGVTSLTPNGLLMANPSGTAVTSSVCASGQAFVSNGTAFSCTAVSTSTTGFVNGGNSFTATGVLGTNDGYPLMLKSGGTTALTIVPSGYVGVGTTAPGSALDLRGTLRFEGSTSGYSGLQSPSTGGNVTWTLPAADGAVGNVLSTNGAGTLSWIAGSSGTVTSVATGAGLTGGPISTAGVISLAPIANNTLHANVSGSSAAPVATTLTSLIDSSIASAQGSILYRNGSTWSALNPGTSGQVLQTGGAAANPSWATPAVGTVTLVGLSLPSIFAVANSPVTSAGTITGSLVTQTANTVFAGPSSGGAVTPTFRALASADLPTVLVAQGGTGVTSLTPNGILMANGTGSSVTAAVCSAGQAYISNGTAFACTAVPNPAFTFVNGGNAFGAAENIGSNDAFPLRLVTSGAARMTILPTGNIGVGTATPSVQFEIDGTASQPDARFMTNYAGVAGGITLGSTAAGGHEFWLAPNSSPGSLQMTDVTSSTLDFAISSNGNFGIKTSAPAYPLDVAGDVNIASANVLRFGGTQVCATAGCTSTSDRRLKQNIAPLQSSLQNILQLQGVSYDWIDREKYGQSHQIGLVAQDLEKIYPEVVVTDSHTGLKSVAYDHLIAPMIEAVKALHAQIQSAVADLTLVKSQVATLSDSSTDHDRSLASIRDENTQLKIQAQRLQQENAAIRKWICGKDPTAAVCTPAP